MGRHRHGPLGRSSNRGAILAVACLAIVVGGCGGDEGDDCSSNADCAADLECLGPNAPQVCGIPATELCASDDDCLPEQRCHAIPDPCSPDGVGSVCMAACTEGSCGEGFRCGDQGSCEAVTCDEGFSCATFEVCDPPTDVSLPVYDKNHGCRRIDCNADADCPATNACVNGGCQSGAGQCVEPMAVP